VGLGRYLAVALAPAEEDALTAVLADLDRVEERLGALAAEGGRQAKVSGRLRDLLLRLESDGRAAEGVDALAEEASDDEIFEFIDRELGIN
jgi:hypothetical protein